MRALLARARNATFSFPILQQPNLQQPNLQPNLQPTRHHFVNIFVQSTPLHSAPPACAHTAFRPATLSPPALDAHARPELRPSQSPTTRARQTASETPSFVIMCSALTLVFLLGSTSAETGYDRNGTKLGTPKPVGSVGPRIVGGAPPCPWLQSSLPQRAHAPPPAAARQAVLSRRSNTTGSCASLMGAAPRSSTSSGP